MKLAAALSIPLFLLPPVRLGAETEISAAALMEKLPSMVVDAPPPPPVTEAQLVELEEGDPETYIFINDARAHPPQPVNLGGDGVLSLIRNGTDERLTVRYRRRNGTYSPRALAALSRLMRCSLTGKETPVSVKLIEMLDAVEDRFGRQGLVLLSGYRTPKLNRNVPGAARRSTHMLGWAADIRVPGQDPEKVKTYAMSLAAGGVGYYPDAAFTHIDAGRPRYWTVRNTIAGAGTGPAARPAAAR